MRIGLGYDIHATEVGNEVVLGGLSIAAPFALKGHSDADVLIHAITDALLGALALGDIGTFFPDTSTKNKNRDSSEFLLFAKNKITEQNYVLVNLDCNIICEQPKIGLHRESIQKNLAKLLEVNIDQISIKGKTKEKLDAVGKQKAIEVHAIALLSKLS